MSIALLGGGGNIGREILAEALARGHEVTALLRDPARLAPRERLKTVLANAYDEDQLVRAIEGHDVFISSFSPDRGGRPQEEVAVLVERAHEAIIGAARRAGIGRFILVGGVGSLKLPSGEDVVDGPGYAENNRLPTLANREILRRLQQDGTGLAWTYVSPPRSIVEGERTGRFRLSHDDLLVNTAGESRISRADFAIAILDELEKRAHIRRRFTAAY